MTSYMIRKVLYIFMFTIISFQITKAQNDTVQANYISFNPQSGNIDVRWEPYTNAPVNYYEVRYFYPESGGISGAWENIANNRILPTEDLTFSFDPALLPSADPLSEPVYIGVHAYDASENLYSTLDTSAYDKSVFLEAQFDSCAAEITLAWNHYRFIQWPQPGTQEYRLYASTDNGTTYNLVDQINSNQNTYTWQGFEENQHYRILITAIAENSADSANSNAVSVETPMAILPEYIEADFASYNNGLVDLSFTIDPLSELSTYKLLRSVSPAANYDTINELFTNDKDLSLQDNPNYYDGPFYYKLIAVNNCRRNIRESDNRSTSMLLEYQGELLSPELKWSTYYNWIDGDVNYVMYRKFLNEEDGVYFNILSDTSFVDSELEALATAEHKYSAQVCYQVSTKGPNVKNLSISNPVCIDLPVNIRFEFDAFSPGSGTGNDTFGPTIDFMPAEYTFKVLDRGGRKVYESKDPENTRWDGRINGSIAPQGAYMAIVQYRIGTSRKQTVTSGVAVVY